ncbi:hypothetical protein Mal33_24800 [Rosistilla oblonga]|uniref:Uncharacterized protein n=1 Tax=Rosistilla oblonga TaxID=2527990 RepID=A0A518ITS4_9BACT|nr:hypothetical protein Mal33_24800 [Rosistilla oblonga]
MTKNNEGAKPGTGKSGGSTNNTGGRVNAGYKGPTNVAKPTNLPPPPPKKKA